MDEALVGKRMIGRLHNYNEEGEGLKIVDVNLVS